MYWLQVTNLNRKVKRGQERVAQDDVQPTVPITSEKSGQLLLVEERIKKLLEQIESLGEAGKVDEAEALMRMVLQGPTSLTTFLASQHKSLLKDEILLCR